MVFETNVKSELLRWARDCNNYSDERMQNRFPKWQQWMLQESNQLSFASIIELADYTHVSVWDLIFDNLSQAMLPVKDFRCNSCEPSRNLLDAIYLCQQKRCWFEEYAERYGIDCTVSFSGSRNDKAIIQKIVHDFDFTIGKNDEDILEFIVKRIEDNGILVVASSIVGNDESRLLNLSEVAGFTLYDDANTVNVPLIFVNTLCSINEIVFQLFHQLAHLYVGEIGLCSWQRFSTGNGAFVEYRCDTIATELLAKTQQLSSYQRSLEKKDYFTHLAFRSSKKFSLALISSVLEGETSYIEGLRLLDIPNLVSLKAYSAWLNF